MTNETQDLMPQYRTNWPELEERDIAHFGDVVSTGLFTTHKQMPSKAKIVEFWYRYGCMVYRKAGSEQLQQLPAFIETLVIDLGEPFCFGCRVRHINWDFDDTKAKGRDKGLHKLFNHWNRLPLERAHIIAVSLQGSNRLRNFVLLCEQCHEESPDVSNPVFLLKWLQGREEVLMNEKIRAFYLACRHYQQNPKYVAKISHKISLKYDEEFHDFEDRFSTNHFGKYSLASHIACLWSLQR